MAGIKTSEGVQLVESFMKAIGGKPAEWYVGISPHADERLEQHGMRGKPYAERWQLESEDAALAVEKHLLNSGLRPAPREPPTEEPREPPTGEPRTQLYVFRAPKMLSFREFLERTEKERDPENKRAQRRREWVAAVEHLVDRLVAWVREVDLAGLLTVIPSEFNRRKRGWGPTPGYHHQCQPRSPQRSRGRQSL